jgi:hypothetical protein
MSAIGGSRALTLLARGSKLRMTDRPALPVLSGFVAGALIFWPLFFMWFLGFYPFPAEPKCAFESAGCPPPGLFDQVVNFVCIFGAMPVTALLFVIYRRWVLRVVGQPED